MKKIFIFTITMTINNFIFCQIWEENAYAENENATFFDLVESFNKYRKEIYGMSPDYLRKIGYKKPTKKR